MAQSHREWNSIGCRNLPVIYVLDIDSSPLTQCSALPPHPHARSQLDDHNLVSHRSSYGKKTVLELNNLNSTLYGDRTGFSLSSRLHRPWAHPFCYTIGNRDSFLGIKAVTAWNWPLSSIQTLQTWYNTHPPVSALGLPSYKGNLLELNNDLLKMIQNYCC